MITREDKLMSLFTGFEEEKDLLKIHKYTCNNCNNAVQVTEEITTKGRKTIFDCPNCGNHKEFVGDEKFN